MLLLLLMLLFILFFVSGVIINMAMVVNADKKLGKYGRSDLWSRSENSVSAMGTMGTMSDFKMLTELQTLIFLIC